MVLEPTRVELNEAAMTGETVEAVMARNLEREAAAGSRGKKSIPMLIRYQFRFRILF